MKITESIKYLLISILFLISFMAFFQKLFIIPADQIAFGVACVIIGMLFGYLVAKAK